MSPQQKNLIYIGILAILVIIIGVLAWFLWKKGEKQPLPSTTATSTPVTVFKGNVPNSTAAPVPLTKNGTYYSVHLSYPGDTPLATTANASADSMALDTLKNYNENLSSSFISENRLDNLSAQDIKEQGLDQGRSYDLGDEYKYYSSPATISYLYTVDEDTLGAHPNSYYKTFTFDAKSGELLALPDLFNPGTNYLGTLSTISRQMLTAQLGANASPDMLDPGTTATEDNFANFVVDGSNLDIFFAPYQVAAYAYGPQTVKIPLSQLSSILKTQYK